MSDRQYTEEEIEAALNGETVEEEVNEEESAPAEEAVEASAEAEVQPDAEPEDEPEPEDNWEVKARKIQAAKDREVAEANRELQKLREELAEKRGREAALSEQQQNGQQEANNSVTVEDLRHGVDTNLAGTFQWTVAYRPDLVPSLITMVRNTEGMGHELADQMVVEYSDYKAQLAAKRAEELYETRAAEREAEQAPLRQREAMESVVESLTERFGENFEAAREEIGKRLETDGRKYIEYLQSEAVKAGEDPAKVVTPQLLREMMSDIYLEIREQALNEKAGEPQPPSKVPATANALGTTSPGNEQTDDTEDFLNSFVSGARHADMQIDPQYLP